MKSYKHNALKTMNIEDIKAGETYYIRVKPVDVCNEEGYINVRDMEWDIACFKAKDVYPVAAPKYDPNRKFKKGDIVHVVERNGRYQPNIPVDELWKGLCTVAEDEDFCNNLVKVRSEDGREKLSHWWYLELITPVEEMEPYVVRLAKPDGVEEWHVEPRNNTLALVAVFGHRHPNAKAAAEAECARLNAEYRKDNAK